MQSDNDNIWKTYALDGADAVREIEESLLSLEDGGQNLDEVNRLYRGLHRLKGNSALLGLLRVEALAHAAEDLVGLVRDSGLPLDRPLTDLMLAMTDRLATLVEVAAAEERDPEEWQVADLLERAREWLSVHAPDRQIEPTVGRGEIMIWSNAPPPPQSTPSEALLDDDVTVELFLALAAERLPAVLDWVLGLAPSPDPEDLKRSLEELRVTAEKNRFGGVATALAGAVSSHSNGPIASIALRVSLADVASALAQLEREYRSRCKTPQDFGMPALYERARGELQGHAGAESGSDSRPEHSSSTTALKSAALQPRATTTGPNGAVRGEPSTDTAAKAEFLRIDASKISLIMDLAGEIGLAAGAVTHHPDLAGHTLEGFAAAAHKLEVLIRELQNEVSAMRLTPVAGVFQRMKRVVRDAANRTHKKVELVLEGEETEIDKVMVDCLHDPLVHVLRNAIDHGIEAPEERLAKGKPEVGRIVLSAAHQGGEVTVRVTDDGRGLNRSRILERARERALVSRDAQLTDHQVTELVFLPGFSTKDAIDELSGRGVGMDLVRSGIEALRGRVTMSSTPEKGSCLNMTVPLTLAFVEAMVVRERGRLFALPIERVSEVFKVEPSQESVNSAEGESILRVREMMIPVLWLHRYYGEPDNEQGTRLTGRVVVVVQTSRGYLALPVDELLGNQPVMLKPLKGLLSRVRASAGCGMLRSGDVALALDCERLLG